MSSDSTIFGRGEAARLDREPSNFEALYRANVAGITGFFARRGVDPQMVADLTSETFVEAIASIGSFNPRVGPARPWLFGIARRVYARHLERLSRGTQAVERFAGGVVLGEDEIQELAARIDDQRRGSSLLAQLRALPELEREAVELVDLDGLSPKEAAVAVGVSAGALRVRLFRGRTKLRRES